MVLVIICALQWQSARSQRSIALETVPQLHVSMDMPRGIGDGSFSLNLTVYIKFTIYLPPIRKIDKRQYLSIRVVRNCIYIYIRIRIIYPMRTSLPLPIHPIPQLRSRYAWHRSQPATSHLVRHRSLIETHPARMPRTRFVDALGPNTGPLDSPTNAWEEKLAIFKRSRKRTWILVVSSTELLEDCSPLLKKTLKATNSSQPENEPLRP